MHYHLSELYLIKKNMVELYKNGIKHEVTEDVYQFMLETPDGMNGFSIKSPMPPEVLELAKKTISSAEKESITVETNQPDIGKTKRVLKRDNDED